MGTFSQWKTSSKTSRVYWVYGTEPVLMSEVVSDIRLMTNAGPFDSYVLWAEETSAAELLDLLRQHTLLDNTPRLVRVKDADTLDSLDFLEEIVTLRNDLPNVHLVLESAVADVPAIISRNSRKIQIVKCSTPNTEDLVKLVRGWSGLSSESSRSLLEWARGDVTAAWHMSQKMRLLNLRSGNSLTVGTFRTIADAVPATFTEALVATRKGEACALAAQVSVSEISGLCALLELRLEQIEDILDYVRSGGSLRSFRGVPGVSYLTVESLAPSVGHYDSARIRRCRSLLALIDAESRSGATIGLLEALVALW